MRSTITYTHRHFTIAHYCTYALISSRTYRQMDQTRDPGTEETTGCDREPSQFTRTVEPEDTAEA